MPLYDVHQRLVVRAKIKDVDAESHADAVKQVDGSDKLNRHISQLLMIEPKNGPVEHIEVDDGEPALSYIVDLVGDEDHAHTLNFEWNPHAQGHVETTYEEPSVPGKLLQTACRAYLNQNSISLADVKRASEIAEEDYLLSYVMNIMSGLATSEIDHALRRLDGAFERLQKVRNAVADLKKEEI